MQTGIIKWYIPMQFQRFSNGWLSLSSSALASTLMTKSLIQCHKSQLTWSARPGKAGHRQKSGRQWHWVTHVTKKGSHFHTGSQTRARREHPRPQHRARPGWSGSRTNPRSRWDCRAFSPTRWLMESHVPKATGALGAGSSHGGFYLLPLMAMRATTQHISLMLRSCILRSQTGVVISDTGKPSDDAATC